MNPGPNQLGNRTDLKSQGVERSFDRDAILATVDHDPTLLREIADLFFEDAPQTLELLREALEDQDTDEVWKRAHALKGAVANFAAQRAQSLAELIEKAGRAGDLESAREHSGAFASELERLLSELRTFVEATGGQGSDPPS